jgi:hypothetical protein
MYSVILEQSYLVPEYFKVHLKSGGRIFLFIGNFTTFFLPREYLEEGDILYSSMIHSIKDIKFGNILLNEGISVNELFVINPEKHKIKEVYDLSEFF